MPRTARKKSETGIYHVMLRGINRETIFNDDEDYERFLQQLKYCKDKSGIELYAYCIMPNHIHLLIKEGAEPLGMTFRRLGSGYVYWYNTKYNRVGHLFQDRYRSEAVEDDEYFLTVLRYIHLNPVKANIVKNPKYYKYSSYIEYINKKEIIDSEFALSILSINEFVSFHKKENNDVCLDISEETKIRTTEEASKRIFKSITNCDSSSEFQRIRPEKRLELIRIMKEKGISIRQIAALTGESFYCIQKL